MEWKNIWQALVMGLLMPGIVLNLAVSLRQYQPEEAPADVGNSIPVLTSRGISEMELEDYLVGVVLAEMPASFEEEALKAQSVVARTYTLASRKHEDAWVCTDSACCQGYTEPADYGGGKENLKKVGEAVSATAGQVLMYDGQLIEATYFSCSGGLTEDAVAVWGTDVPYLRSVESPGEEGAAHYTDSVSFDREELAQILGLREVSFGAATYTNGGGVATMEISGEVFTGVQLRTLLGLRSTAFRVSEGEEITFTTYGYGHRVGMSQYGADAMAATGYSYADILAHYYRGTVLASWNN